MQKVPIGFFLTLKSEFTPFWACPHHNLLPIQARITKFGPEVQNSLVKIPIVLGGNWVKFGQIWLKSRMFWSHHYWKYITTIKPPEIDEYLDCFTGPTVSWSPSSLHTYIPRLFHGPDCFTVSTHCTYSDLGNRGYFGVYRRSCYRC